MKNNIDTPAFSTGQVANFPDGSFCVHFGQSIKGIVLLSPEEKEIERVCFGKQKASRAIKGDVKLLQIGGRNADKNRYN